MFTSRRIEVCGSSRVSIFQVKEISPGNVFGGRISKTNIRRIYNCPNTLDSDPLKHVKAVETIIVTILTVKLNVPSGSRSRSLEPLKL